MLVNTVLNVNMFINGKHSLNFHRGSKQCLPTIKVEQLRMYWTKHMAGAVHGQGCSWPVLAKEAAMVVAEHPAWFGPLYGAVWRNDYGVWRNDLMRGQTRCTLPSSEVARFFPTLRPSGRSSTIASGRRSERTRHHTSKATWSSTG